MKSSDASKLTEQDSLWTLIQIGKQHYALPSEAITQAMAAPQRFPLPYAPAHIIGMAHFDGDVLPCVALDIAFGLADEAPAYQECVIVRHDGRRAIIMATSVLRHISLANQDVHSVNRDDIETASSNSAILGEINVDGISAFLLDPAYLVIFSARREHTNGRPGLVDSVEEEQAHSDEDDLSCYLFVSIGGQHYAVDVDLVSEIVTFDAVTCMPGAPAPLRGLCIVRDHSYLLLSSSQWLGISSDSTTNQAIIVTTPCGEILLDIDSVESVSNIPSSKVRPLTHVDSCLSGVIEAENQPLRGILNVSAIPRCVPELQRFIPKVEDHRHAESEEALFSYLLIRWDRELFAIDLSEIIRLEKDGEARSIEDERFSAVFNFDGDTIPVIREDLFYGMASRDDHRDGYMVLSADGSPYAVPLQNAERIIATQRSNILKRGSQHDDRFSGTIRHNDKLVTLFNMSFFRRQAFDAQGSAQ